MLKDGITRQMFIDKDSIKYFKFVVPEGKKELLINLYSNDDIYMLALILHGDDVPTFEHYDWFITSWAADEQVISKENYPDHFKNQDSIAGDYMILVYSFQKTTFSIQATCLQTRVLQLQSGLPIEVSVKP